MGAVRAGGIALGSDIRPEVGRISRWVFMRPREKCHLRLLDGRYLRAFEGL